MKKNRLFTLLIFISTICFSQGKSELLDSLFSTMSHRDQFYGHVLIAENNKIKDNPKSYQIDLHGLKFLVMKLEQSGNKEKADLIINSFKPE